jgi:acetolactate synthase-1/2/3 large subunit
MTAQELVTASAERIPIKVAILNNAYLGMVRQWQELFYANNYVAVDLKDEIIQPDFLKIAEAYGIKAIRVTEKEGVRGAIEEANAHPGPVLLDFHVIKEENVWPMVPAGASLAETIEDPAKNRVPVAGD